MQRVKRAIELVSLFLVLAYVLGGTAPTPAAAHYPGVRAMGWGTATI